MISVKGESGHRDSNPRLGFTAHALSRLERCPDKASDPKDTEGYVPLCLWQPLTTPTRDVSHVPLLRSQLWHLSGSWQVLVRLPSFTRRGNHWWVHPADGFTLHAFIKMCVTVFRFFQCRGDTVKARISHRAVTPGNRKEVFMKKMTFLCSAPLPWAIVKITYF